MTNSKDANHLLQTSLRWLADAPMFIDSDQVARFHDAVVRPAFEEGATTLEINTETAVKAAGKLGLEASVEPSALLAKLATFLPFVKAELKVSGEVSGDVGHERKQGEKIERRPINTPQRQLEQLVLHYLLNHPDRLFDVPKPADPLWRSPPSAAMVPRGLVLLDMAAGSQFIPTAAEFGSGKIVPLFDKFGSEKSPAPPYPEAPKVSEPELPAKRKEYWAWFAKNISPRVAMEVIEKASTEANAALRWIDYRVPVTTDGDTVHLHVAPSGKYDVGTFAYNLVKRGHKHGLRVVGTLKAEPDINVLAIYEK